MDPNEALKNARECVRRINKTENEAELAQEADNLAETFEALDGWLTSGGFLPKAWERTSDVAAFVQAVVDTDAISVAQAQSGEEPLDAIDVASVVDAILRGERFHVSSDDKLFVWASDTFTHDVFSRVFAVESDSVDAIGTLSRDALIDAANNGAELDSCDED